MVRSRLEAEATAPLAMIDDERRFRLLTEDVAGFAIFMLDPDGTVANWNAGA